MDPPIQWVGMFERNLEGVNNGQIIHIDITTLNCFDQFHYIIGMGFYLGKSSSNICFIKRAHHRKALLEGPLSSPITKKD